MSNKRCTKYRIHFGASNAPTAVVKSRQLPWYIVYIHCTYANIFLPLSAKLVHIELLLTHKLATVNLWLLIAAYEQSLICYRARCKHSCIPGAYPRKHLLIPCPTNNVVGHILAIVSNKHVALPLTKARVGLERQRQTCAVWAKRTEYSIEQIRQSLQRLKIAKIVRMQNLHNFRTIDSVFSDTRLRYKLSIIDPRPSQTHTVGHSSRNDYRRYAPRNHPPNQEDPGSVHDIWATIHMSSQQLAATNCFHYVNKVSYS